MRARDDAARSAALLLARGFVVARAPATEIRATGALPPPGPFDAVVATSAKAIALLAPAARAAIVGAPLYVVGEQTAQAAAAGGDCGRGRGRAGRRRAHRGAAPAPRAPFARAVSGRARTQERAGGRPERSRPSHDAGGSLCRRGARRLERRRGARGGGCAAALHYSRRSAALAVALAERGGPRRPFSRAFFMSAFPRTPANRCAPWARRASLAPRSRGRTGSSTRSNARWRDGIDGAARPATTRGFSSRGGSPIENREARARPMADDASRESEPEIAEPAAGGAAPPSREPRHDPGVIEGEATEIHESPPPEPRGRRTRPSEEPRRAANDEPADGGRPEMPSRGRARPASPSSRARSALSSARRWRSARPGSSIRAPPRSTRRPRIWPRSNAAPKASREANANFDKRLVALEASESGAAKAAALEALGGRVAALESAAGKGEAARGRTALAEARAARADAAKALALAAGTGATGRGAGSRAARPPRSTPARWRRASAHWRANWRG